MRFIFWLNRLWYDWRDAKTPRVTRREEWWYRKEGEEL